MKNFTLLCAVLLFSTFQLQAQFTDDMEYPNGPPLGEWWQCWDQGNSCGPLIGSPAHTGNYSGSIDGGGTMDVILDMGNKIFGEWYLIFWAYIPSGKMGYFNVQATNPTIPSWCGEIYLNRDGTTAGAGEVLGAYATTFDFPHDEWFEIRMHWDINSGLSLATWDMDVAGVNVVPPVTPYVDTNGVTPAGLGGINFFSASPDCEFYFDDFNYTSFLSIDDLDEKKFSLYPNPAIDELHIEAANELVRHKIYSPAGQIVMEQSASSSVNVSNLTSGIYFIELETNQGKSVQKFIKN